MVFFTRDSYGCFIQDTRDRTVVMVVVSVSVVVSDRVVKLRYAFRCKTGFFVIKSLLICYGLCFPPPCAVL